MSALLVAVPGALVACVLLLGVASFLERTQVRRTILLSIRSGTSPEHVEALAAAELAPILRSLEE